MNREEFIKVVDQERQAQGLSVHAYTKKLGVVESLYRHWLHGGGVTLDKADQVLKALGISATIGSDEDELNESEESKEVSQVNTSNARNLMKQRRKELGMSADDLAKALGVPRPALPRKPKTVTGIIREVQEAICDGYCKYPEQYEDDPDKMITEHCNSCPLGRLGS
ncbi:MAG: hypothetical protein MR671_04825 [Clostridiales bacterium]|nr:hypothetical protein [Clostridiales bacterium]